MTFKEIEEVIISTGLMLQTVLHAAFVVEECETIGGGSCFGCGEGSRGDLTHTLDRAMSVTRHIRDGEGEKLRRWVATDEVDPRRWPRLAVVFWMRVPRTAAQDMAKVAPSIV